MLFMVEDLNAITAALKEEQRKLELSNRELDAFTYSVSHDLRAPLRAINGYSKFLEEDYSESLDEEGKRFLLIIRAECNKTGPSDRRYVVVIANYTSFTEKS
jgi:light-regulated signal transduction histidine kinase (bacteriophytochrome)